MPRTLTILLNSTRDAAACFPLMQKHLLEPMDSDLAFCGAFPTNKDDIIIRNSKYIWGHEEPSSWAYVVDHWRDNRGAWREVNQLSRNNHLFALGAKDGIVGSGIIVTYWRDYLSNSLTEDIISSYDWFIFTRSDFYWSIPHPSLNLLSRDHIYIQDSEYHGGVPDRHFIVPQLMVRQFIQLSSPIFSHPNDLIDRVLASDSPALNIEAYLKFRLKELGLFESILALPQMGFLVRSPEEDSRHSMGEYHRGLGLFIKYIAEFRAASFTSDLVNSPGDWKYFVSPMTKTIAAKIPLCGSLPLPFHSNEIFWRPGRLSRELRRYKPAYALLLCIGLLLQLFERGLRRMLCHAS